MYSNKRDDTAYSLSRRWRDSNRTKDKWGCSLSRVSRDTSRSCRIFSQVLSVDNKWGNRGRWGKPFLWRASRCVLYRFRPCVFASSCGSCGLPSRCVRNKPQLWCRVLRNPERRGQSWGFFLKTQFSLWTRKHVYLFYSSTKQILIYDSLFVKIINLSVTC